MEGMTYMNDMNVIRKTSSGIQSLSLDAVLLDKRMIFLSGVITSASVDLIVKQLLFLEGLDERERVKLIINSSSYCSLKDSMNANG